MDSPPTAHDTIRPASIPEQWQRAHKNAASVYRKLWAQGQLVIDPDGLLLAPRIADLFQANARVVDRLTQSTRMPLLQWTGRSFLLGSFHAPNKTSTSCIVGRLTQGAWHVYPRPCMVPQRLITGGGEALDPAVDGLFSGDVPLLSATPEHPDHPAWALPHADVPGHDRHPSYVLSSTQRHDLFALMAGCIMALVEKTQAFDTIDQASIAPQRGGWIFHTFEPHLPPSKSVAFLYHGPSEAHNDPRLSRFERALNDALLRWCAEGRLPRFFFDGPPDSSAHNPFGTSLTMDVLAPSAHARVHALAFWREAQNKAR